MRSSGIAAPAALGLLLALPAQAEEPLPTVLPPEGFEAREEDDNHAVLPPGQARAVRTDALTRAKLWRELERPVSAADLRENPGGPDSFAAADEVICKFHPRKSGGSTPKFECVFEGGEVLKVKYGRNPEIHTEVAATRLLAALGAGADRMYFVKRLRCFGCPEDPHQLLRCISSPIEEVRRQCQPNYGETTPTGEFKVRIDYAKYVDFAPVAIERRAEGSAIETSERKGWGWDELDRLQSASGGSTRAERDALRLLAVFLNNWDNRADNQRLVCLPGDDGAGGRCSRPFAYMHDVGGTFGHVGGESKQERKLDVEGWNSVPIWKDPANCVVGIKSPALHGATFGEARISEPGRRFLAEKLLMLTRRQIRDLFEGAGVVDFDGAGPANRDVGRWVKAFEDKVGKIVELEQCPTL